MTGARRVDGQPRALYCDRAACARSCVSQLCLVASTSGEVEFFFVHDPVHGWPFARHVDHLYYSYVIMWLQCELSSFDAMSRPSFLLIIIIIMIIIIIIIKSTTNDESYHVMTF